MFLYLKRANYLAYAFVISVSFWMGLLFLQVSQRVDPHKISDFSAQAEFFVHFLTLVAVFALFVEMSLKDRIIAKWLILANVFLFLNDLTFYIAVYFQNNHILSSSFVTLAIGYTPYIVWISSIIVFLSNVLIRDIFSISHFFKVVPFFVLMNLTIIFLFFSSVHYAFPYLSWESIAHVLSFMGEFIIFDLALVCLIYSENKGVSVLLLGCITLISGDFFVNYSFLSQTSILLGYGELLWFLGLIFILFGVLEVLQSKSYVIQNWFSRTNTIKNKLAFWSFGTSILSFLLFFTIAYFFSVINQQLFLGLPLFVMMYSVIVVIFSIVMGKRFETPFKKLTANVEALMLQNDKSKIDDDFSTQEFIFLQKFIFDAFEVKAQKEIAQQAIVNLTKQVAHDIKSPLLALKSAMDRRKKGSLSEQEYAQFIERSVLRIEQILMNLKASYQVEKPDFSTSLPKRALLPMILMAQYECKMRLSDIEFENNFQYEHFYSRFRGVDFIRVLTNLFNNAIAATLSRPKKIKVSLSESNGQITLAVEDYGKGIPQHIKGHVFEHGFTYGKKDGTGLGLSFVKSTVESWGGSISLASVEGQGTTVSIALPKCDRPSYVLHSLDLTHIQRIVYLDDDESCHDMLKSVLMQAKSSIEIKSYYSPVEFKQDFNTISGWGELFFFDLQYQGEEERGTDLIDQFKIKEKSIIITSSREDDDVINFCELNGIKLIYKDKINHIPIIS